MLDITRENEATLLHDGRSMFQPSGARIRMGFGNPGGHMMLHADGYVLVRTLDGDATFYDLTLDPEQLHPHVIGKTFAAAHNWAKPHDIEDRMWHWSLVALSFIERNAQDLTIAYQTGEVCTNCSISFMQEGESLFDWPSAETILKKFKET